MRIAQPVPEEEGRKKGRKEWKEGRKEQTNG